jgi:hypothetical protein
MINKDTLSSEQFAMGYKRGLRDGQDKSGEFEQDFAYSHPDYERGYWDGFKAGRKIQFPDMV